MFRDKIIFAGAGGQGALRIGQMVAYASLDKGYEVTWMPSYGAEMRGGTAKCDVTVSDEEIPFAAVDAPDCCVVMNEPSLDKFEKIIEKNGILIINSDMIKKEPERKDIIVYKIPADAMAEREGSKKGMNMVMLGAYTALSERIDIETVCNVIARAFAGDRAKYAESNKKLAKAGYEYIKGRTPEMPAKERMQYEKNV